MNALAAKVRAELTGLADADKAAQMRRLVPGIKTVGASVPNIRAMAAAFHREHRTTLTTKAALGLLEALAASGSRDDFLAGLFILARSGIKLTDADFTRLDRLVDTIDNWETCDQMAAIAIAPACIAAPARIAHLAQWAGSANPWRRRCALATTAALNHGRHGHVPETLALCRILAADTDSMVRKALAWALREAARKDEAAVSTFLATEGQRMHPTTLQEAGRR